MTPRRAPRDDIPSCPPYNPRRHSTRLSGRGAGFKMFSFRYVLSSRKSVCLGSSSVRGQAIPRAKGLWVMAEPLRQMHHVDRM